MISLVMKIVSFSITFAWDFVSFRLQEEMRFAYKINFDTKVYKIEPLNYSSFFTYLSLIIFASKFPKLFVRAIESLVN